MPYFSTTRIVSLAILTLVPALVALAETSRVTISADALLQPDNQMLWQLVVNRAPGDGVAIDINPPRLRWFYVPDMPQLQARDPSLLSRRGSAGYGTCCNKATPNSIRSFAARSTRPGM